MLTGTNADGSSYFYIQDEESVAQYGVIERVLTIKSVRSLTNSTADVRNAANALKLMAESYLKRRRGLTTHYSLTVQGLRKPLRPGQRVPVRYTGVSDNYAYLDIDTDLWVLAAMLGVLTLPGESDADLAALREGLDRRAVG